MPKILVCRACLSTDVKMVEMDLTALNEFFFNLTGIKAGDPLNYLCFECSALILKYQNFRDKCLRANSVIMNIKRTHETLTKEIFKDVNRKLYRLESLYTIHRNRFINYLQEISDSKNDHNFDTDGNDVKLESNSIEDKIKSESFDNSLSEKNGEPLDIIIFNDTFKENVDDIPDNDLNNVDSSDDISLKEYFDKRKEKRKRGRPRKNVESKKATDKTKGNGKIDLKYFEGYATVVDLTPEMARQEVLLRKESKNYISCEYKCDMCYRGFEAKKTFDNHMNKHSNDFGNSDCEYCHLKFPNKKCLWKHIYTSHKRKFCCNLCPYVCFCSSQARLHINLHKGKTYLCNECGEVFSMPNSLLMHKRAKHPTECVCAYCGSTFATEWGLRSHILKLHRLEKNEKQGPHCKDCNIEFYTDTAWKRHLVLSAKHKISNGCEFCGETFEDEVKLKKHLRVHARKQSHRDDIKLPAACPLCPKWLCTREEYRVHVVREHPGSPAAVRERSRNDARAMCETCGAVFKKHCFLVYHQRTHSGSRPLACAQCGRRYRSPPALAAHTLTHTRPRDSHACHLCTNTYRTRNSLLKHVKAHLGIRPHKCKICDKSFPNRCDVRTHMQYVHYKVPWPKRDRTKRNKPTDCTPDQETTDQCLYNNVNE